MRWQRGFPVHTSKLHTTSASALRQSLFLFLHLPLSGRWCGKSVVLTGTRWSTTLKAVVAVKEEGCRLERKRWVDRVHEEEGVVWSYGTTMYLICRPLYGLGYSWWSGDGVLVGAWCTATKGGGVVVWGGGEILIKTYPGTNPCRLSPSPPRFIQRQPHGTPSSLYTSLASSLERAERSQWLSRGNISTNILFIANYVAGVQFHILHEIIFLLKWSCKIIHIEVFI